MRSRPPIAPLAAFALSLAFVASAGGAGIGIYSNPMATPAQRGELVKLTGRNCARGGSERALRITIGKRTKECSYRSPVVGRNLQIAASERLLSITPKRLQHTVFIGLILRTGGGSGYQLAVYPYQQKIQLRKNLPGGQVTYLAIVRGQRTVRGVDKANEVALSAIDQTSGPERGTCRLLAYVGGKLVAAASDPHPRELQGGASGVEIGAATGAAGAAASVESVVVRVPSPF